MKHEVIPVHVEGSAYEASLVTYLIENYPSMGMERRRPVVIICPGGGYEHLSDREGEPYARKLLAAGFHAAVLRYSLAPVRFPEALLQLAWSVAYLREHAKELAIDPERVFVMGSSAGGHLAASLGVFWNKLPFLSARVGADMDQIRPDGMVLCYPVITSGDFAHEGTFENLLGEELASQKSNQSLEAMVDAGTPPAFLWHTAADEAVPVENSILFFSALRWSGVPCEMHIFPEGVHGLALATEETMHADGSGVQRECAVWMDLAIDWLRRCA